MTSRLSVFPADNQWGRRTTPGARELASERRLRKVATSRLHNFHRAKNGIYDPMTFVHVVEALLDTVPGSLWKTADFVEYLRETRDQLTWDPQTVGRVLADIAESLNDANAAKMLNQTRRWDGMYYDINTDLETKAALVHLLDDLMVVCARLREVEAKGKAPARKTSPLRECPSVSS